MKPSVAALERSSENVLAHDTKTQGYIHFASLEYFLSLVIALGVVGFWYVLFSYSADKDLIRNYPFWWPDTFDWTKQAVMLLNKFSQRMTETIGVWRPREPFLILIIAGSIAFNTPWLILFALGLTQILFVLGMLRLGWALGLSFRSNLIVLALIILNYTFTIFSYYIMADFMAITAMIWVSSFMVQALKGDPKEFGFFRALRLYFYLGLSTITQVFTVLPGVAFTGLMFLKARGWNRLTAVIAAVLAVGVIRWIITLAKQFIYGTSFDDRLKYLKFTTESISFYSESLFVLCLPIIFILIWQFLFSRRNSCSFYFDQVDAFLIGTIAIFLGLILSYSTWQEARLLTYFLPFVYLCFARLMRGVVDPRGTGNFLGILIALYLTVTPVGGIMSPQLHGYLTQLAKPRELSSLNVINFGLTWKGEDRRWRQCVRPGANRAAGFFGPLPSDCDQYQHYNLRIYWCYIHNAKKCFKKLGES